MVAGLVLALRLLGGATVGGARAVWLADRLAVMVTRNARDRTTPVSAALLHCAARGQAAAEVISVLRAFEGREPAPGPPWHGCSPRGTPLARTWPRASRRDALPCSRCPPEQRPAR